MQAQLACSLPGSAWLHKYVGIVDVDELEVNVGVGDICSANMEVGTLGTEV